MCAGLSPRRVWAWWLVLGLVCGFVLESAGADQPRRPPNVILIMADDLGYGDLSCYGNSSFKTPQLDRMAAGGLRFTDFHTSGAVCSPTRAGLLTGRYQQRAGLDGVINADPRVNRHHGLQAHEVTLPQLLNQADYVSGIFGKWHLGYEAQYNPTLRGFDVFRGFVSGNIDYHSHFDRMGVFDWWHNRQRVREEGYSTHLITRHSLAFIRAHKDRPFFCYVAHEAPHSPFQGPNDPAFRVEGRVVPERVGPEDRRRAYREMVEELDRGVGQTLDLVDELGLDNTLVIFLSDNGAAPPGSNAPLRGNKGSLWEGGHRVPLLAHWPGRLTPGERTQTTISLDLAPTILELAGVAADESKPLDGVSLTAVLDDDAALAERTLFWQFGQQSAVRHGPWKWIRGAPGLGAEAGLFHLGDDLGETRNLADTDTGRPIVARLSRAFSQWQADIQATATQQPERPAEPDL